MYERRSEEPFAAPVPFPLNHLVDCLDGRATPLATIRDARASFAMALAAYDSARVRRPVRLEA